MGKLNILYHKSYHVYNRQNVERVQRDELQARLESEAKDQATIAANSEARLDLLRKSAQSSKSSSQRQKLNRAEKDLDKQLSGKQERQGRLSSSSNRPDDEVDHRSNHLCCLPRNRSLLDPKSGHINFWSELEHQQAITTDAQGLIRIPDRQTQERMEKNQSHMKDQKSKEQAFDDLITMRLDRPAHELEPWYNQPDLVNGKAKKISQAKVLENRSKDSELKDLHDPLTMIKKTLYPRSARALRPPKRKHRMASKSPSPTTNTLASDVDDDESDVPALPPSPKTATSSSSSAATPAHPTTVPLAKTLKVDVLEEKRRAQQLIEAHRRNTLPKTPTNIDLMGYSDMYNPSEVDLANRDRYRSSNCRSKAWGGPSNSRKRYYNS